jgi:acyl carrier protein
LWFWCGIVGIYWINRLSMLTLKMIDKNLKLKIENEISKKINLNKSFIDNELDSLDLITAVSIIEDEFKIEIKENSLKKIKNFKTLDEFIKKKLRSKRSS